MKKLEDQILELEARIKALEEKVSRIKHDALRQPIGPGGYTPIGFKGMKK